MRAHERQCRDERIVRQYNSGQFTHAAIAETENLSERQVQRIVAEFQKANDEDIATLRRLPSHAEPTPQGARALLDEIDESFVALLRIVGRYNKLAEEELFVMLAERRFKTTSARLRSIVDGLAPGPGPEKRHSRQN